MRPDAIVADRRHAVRAAARSWHKAGAIDESTRRAIDSAYADDRYRLGLGLRALAGITTFVGGMAGVWLFVSVTHLEDGIVPLIFAGLFAIATEVLIGRGRRVQAGMEYATAMLAVSFACAYVDAISYDTRLVSCSVWAFIWALAAWRWGYALFGAVAACIILYGLTDGVHPRLDWILLGALAVPVLAGHRFVAARPPAHRRALTWSAALFMAAGYAACNIYVLDEFDMGRLDGGDQHAAAWSRTLAAIATAVIPAATLGLGIAARSRTLLLLGGLFTAASCATLRYYVHLAPLWVVLTLSGAACAGIALALRHWLETGEGRERRGFTAETLYDARGGLGLAQTAATIAAATPSASPAAARTFEGGGGASGGGGAQGQF